MEADIFSLFDPNCLKSILSDLNRHNELIKDFARFLSAYFANLPLICSKTKRLPSLFYPANYVDYYEINRQDVSIKLPITYSPSLAVQLLFKCGLLLETTFYVEHFNDIRSALIIRHLVDIKYGLKLFDDYCDQKLIGRFFSQFQSLIENDFADQIYSYLRKFVDVIVQLSVVFDLDLFKRLSHQLVDRIECLSNAFDDEISEIVALPRPPIYALPSESVFDQEVTKELRIWNELHYLIKTYILLLQRTNHLSSLIQQTTAWLCRLNVDFKTELSTIIEIESDKLDDEILEQFNRVILVVLRTNIRDALSLSIRYGDSESKIDLFSLNTLNTTTTLKRWAESADQSDFNQVMLFFKFVQENAGQNECYLPPLSDVSLEKWKFVIFMQSRQNHINPENELIILNDMDKLKVTNLDYKRLIFVAHSLPSLSLNDPSLIQILLKLQPSDFCFFSQDELFNDVKQAEITEQCQIEEQQTLKRQIRATIRRLSRQALTTRAGSIRYIPFLVDDFNTHLSASERRSDLQFLSTVHNLTTKTRPRIKRSLSDKNIAPIQQTSIPISVWKAQRSVQTETNEDLGNELRAISARLAKIKQKWTVDNETQVEEKLQSLSSGISSSNSQSDLPEDFANKQKRYRKRRPKTRSQYVQNDEEINKTYELEDNIEQPEVDIPIAIPTTPASIERLDFSLLSDRDEKPKQIGWSEVSILEKSPPTNKTVKKTPKTNVYPDWLTLIPLEETSTSSRLLDLKIIKKRQDSIFQEPNRPSKVYDSGFLESERARVGLNMSPNEICRLIAECDK